jgi:hypothetical protein
MLVNNGRYRRSLLMMRKFLDGTESFIGGFPISESILSSFAEYPALTQEEFQRLNERAYQMRLSAFYVYMSLKHPFFSVQNNIPDSSDESINSSGSDADYCPLNHPLASRIFLSLLLVTRKVGSENFATILITMRNGDNQPVTLPTDLYLDYVLKSFDGLPELDWPQVEGSLVNDMLPSGASEKILVPEFQYRGTVLLRSVQVQLIGTNESESIYNYPIDIVTVTAVETSYLLNHISNLQQAYQEMISNQIVQEKINLGEGIRALGKRDYIFTFEPDQPKRPVFVYPKYWGKLSEVILVQASNMNIIYDGAFLFDNNGEPFEYDLLIDDELIACYIYASKAMISYRSRTEYLFRF